MVKKRKGGRESHAWAKLIEASDWRLERDQHQTTNSPVNVCFCYHIFDLWAEVNERMLASHHPQDSRQQRPASPSKGSSGQASPSRRGQNNTNPASSSSPAKDRTGSRSSVLSHTSSHNEQINGSSPIPTSPKKRPSSPPKSRANSDNNDRATLEHDFEQMLLQRETPLELRHKLAILDPAVKLNLLRNQATVNLASLGALTASGSSSRGYDANEGGSTSPRRNDRGTSRMRSSSPFKSLRAKKSQKDLKVDVQDEDEAQTQEGSNLLKPPAKSSLFGSASRSSSGQSNGSFAGRRSPSPDKMRGTSFVRSVSPTRGSHGPSNAASSSSSTSAVPASRFASYLLNTSSRKLDIDMLKKLRMLLSTESPAWLAEFLFTERGYEGLLRRVGELIEMEWREEIHDDRALHELLRGMAALGATDKGLMALSSLLFRAYTSQASSSSPTPTSANDRKLPGAAPATCLHREETPPELPLGWHFHPPFGPLAAMLFSERKPGDLNTRKLIIDVLALLPTVQVPNGLTLECLRPLQEHREASKCYKALEFTSPSFTSTHLLLLLLHNPITPKARSMLSFISQSHQSRPFKTYLLEISGVIRDYFWIFCHSTNRFWNWEKLGEEGRRKIAGPMVPGGMTGGVEFEAMSYITTHLRLLNQVSMLLLNASPSSIDTVGSSSGTPSHPDTLFHLALFDSGMERILSTLRRASQQYYAPMHLELAHYLYLVGKSGVRVPSEIEVQIEGNGIGPLNFAPLGLPTSGRREQVAVKEQGSPKKKKKATEEMQWDLPWDTPLSSPTKDKAFDLQLPEGFSTVIDRSRGAQDEFESGTVISRPASPNKLSFGPLASIKTRALPSTPITQPLPAVEQIFKPTTSSYAPRPSTSSSTSNWLNNEDEATSAATAMFLATASSSKSVEDFFNAPWPSVEVAVASGVELPPSPMKKERPLLPEKESYGFSGSAAETAPSRSPIEQPSTSRPQSSIPPPTSGAATIQFGNPSKAGGGVHHIKVGTAKDRIRLWEERGTMSGSR